MKKLERAIAVALGSMLCAGAANAATFVVTANSQNFDASLARKIEAAGGRVTARLPQIGVAIVESSDANFQLRAGKVPGIFSVARDVALQFEQPPTTADYEGDYANPPASGDNDTRFDLQWGHAAIDAAGAWN